MTALLTKWLQNKDNFAQSACSICDVNELSGIKSNNRDLVVGRFLNLQQKLLALESLGAFFF